jgi:site-specific DNA recombinase
MLERMPRAAAIYTRISKDDGEGQGLGVARQEKDCRALADAKGWPVAQVFTDNDVGAYSGKARPSYLRMLDEIEGGEIDAVLIWHLDRLTRRPAELEAFFDVCDKAGVKALATVTGDIDLATDDGRFLARILGAAARKESDDKSRRTKRKHLEVAQAGLPVGGFRAFGYEDDKITVRADEAAMIRDAAMRVLAGESIRRVVMDWNNHGLTGPRGGRWTQTSLRKILVSARVAGLRSLGGEVVADAVWPPILDRPTWERVRVTLESRRTRDGFGARTYLLSGFCRCGRCGSRLVSQPRSNRRRSYTCSSNPDKPGCGGVRVIAEPLEELVVEAVKLAVDSPELAQAVRDHEDVGDDAADTAELERATARLEELSAMWAREEISRAEWLEARRVVERRIEGAQARLAAQSDKAAVRSYVGREGVLRAAWPSLSFDRQRAVIAALIDRVTILPAHQPRGRFDPARVDLTWRA